ncbi:uncharacterized protein L203_101691 [Cryptococcus depauperatus CBS 7841]|uniref:PPM-type phosphatase domain-containing protein n=1 Tax=Cryptococcus depauperatus CBS 7841 TaxID=1295531 RepID=A0AAJ8JQB9_9TREE
MLRQGNHKQLCSSLARRYSSKPLPPDFTPNPSPKQPFGRPYYGTMVGLSVLGLVGGATLYLHTGEKPYIHTTLFNGHPAKMRSVRGEWVELRYPSLSTANKEYVFKYRLLDEDEAEEMLQGSKGDFTVDREGNPIKSLDKISLASNSPSEDRWTFDIVTRQDLVDIAKQKNGYWWFDWWKAQNRNRQESKSLQPTTVSGDQDIVMCSVWDGHGGDETAQLLKQSLHGCLAWNLGKMFDKGPWQWLAQKILGESSGSKDLPSPESFSKLISDTFIALDDDIVFSPQRMFKSAPDNKINPLLPPHLPSTMTLSPLLNSGACCCTAIVDVASDRLYVANAGDTRAVAGWWNEEEKTWRCDVLTQDCMGDNPVEVQRMVAEHPEDEKDTVVCDVGSGARVLGGLQPTRAFGDSIYKAEHTTWQDVHKGLLQYDHGKRWRKFDECPNKTPPYATAKPEIAWRDIHPENGEELKFVVIATDGQEASHLLAAHLANPKREQVERVALPLMFPHQEPLPNDVHPYPKEDMTTEGSWVFEDDNSALHLTRNSLGGGDKELRRQFLSMQNPGVRNVRDDITAIVMWFDNKAVGKDGQQGDMALVQDAVVS